MSILDKNNESQLGSNHIEKLISVLPSNCTCPICVETKLIIKNILGEKEFILRMKKLGKNHCYI